MDDPPYSGRIAEGAHRFAVRVYYADTDAGGVVYHANYLNFFERARFDFLERCGADHVGALEAGEGAYVVAEATLRYLRPARLNDALVIVSRVEAVRAASCVIQQRVMRDGEGLVEGRVVVAWVWPDGRPKSQTPEWIEAFRAIAIEKD